MTWLLLGLTALFAWIAWNRPSLGFVLLATVLPSYLLRTDVFSVPVTLLELLVLTQCAVWFIKERARWQEVVQLTRPLSLLIALLLLSATISAVFAPNLFAALGVWKAYFLEPILLFYVLKDALARNELRTESLLRALVLGGGFVALVAIIQWMTGAGIPIPWDIERRVTGVFDYPNAVGLLLGPLAILSLFDQKTRFMFPVLILAIVLAQSEAALAAVFITVTLLGLWSAKWRRVTLVSLFIVGIILVLSTNVRLFVWHKLTFQDYSGQVRLTQWTETIDLLRAHPFFGAGLSHYPTALIPFHRATHIEIFQYPHQLLLNIWVELGLLGVVAITGLGMYLGKLWIRLRRLPLTQLLPFFALLQMTIHGLVDVPYFKNDLALLTWILIALISAVYVSKKQSSK